MSRSDIYARSITNTLEKAKKFEEVEKQANQRQAAMQAESAAVQAREATLLELRDELQKSLQAENNKILNTMARIGENTDGLAGTVMGSSDVTA